MAVQLTENEQRFFALLEELRRRHPESAGLINEVSGLLSSVCIEHQDEAVRHQGRVIMAAIRGELTAWPDCAPQLEVVLDDEREAS